MEESLFTKRNTFYELLKKYSVDTYASAKVPMGFGNNIFSDPSGEAIDQKKYRGMIRSMLHLTASHLNIMFSTCVCATLQANRKMSCLLDVNHIFWYLKGTKSLGIWYPTHESFLLQTYSDSKYGSLQIDRKSASGACQFLGGKLIPIYCGSQSVIVISHNLIQHSMTKHIDIQYHFIKDHVLNGYIDLIFVLVDEEIADVFTMAMNESKFDSFLKKWE
ncbi:uncharacterized protein LOC111885251 [Lactuca sativa]|uniref:uncharacterized protein LOC111885251 n=1 Tax=Lactuca sativa TaxID=4236 RepID=UPI000CD97302|nr:uncharacterized protein LOC111885251 [Lactuca sativa]